MKTLLVILAGLLAVSSSTASYGKTLHGAWVVYTALDTVSSRGGAYGVAELKALSHEEKLLDASGMSALVAAFERAKIGKSTQAERRQLKGPVFLAVFSSADHRDPIYVSDGCLVLNRKTGDLFRLEADVAVQILGMSAENFEARLCKEPGLGITLSPR